MTDLNWLANQAHQIHDYFGGIFYALVGLFLCLGIFIEYFKWPLGEVPAFSVLIGRALIAAILLQTFTEVSNAIADVADALASDLGNMNSFKLVLSVMGDKVTTLTWSWVSLRDWVILLLSFLTFFLLYFSVHVVESFLLYTWTLLYVFSPILIALFVLPATAPATKALYRSLIEVSAWKVVWSVLATLLWSAALSDINKPEQDVNFISAICFNLILAGSLLLTPVVVHSLAGAGLSGMAKTVGGVAVGAAMVSPTTVVAAAKSGMSRSYEIGSRLKERYFANAKPGAAEAMRRATQGSRQALKPSDPVAKQHTPSKAPRADDGSPKTPTPPPSDGGRS